MGSSPSSSSDLSQAGSGGTYTRGHSRGFALRPRRVWGRHVLIGGGGIWGRARSSHAHNRGGARVRARHPRGRCPGRGKGSKYQTLVEYWC